MTLSPPNPSDARTVPGTRFRVVSVPETGSTNSDLLAAAQAGAEPGLVIVTDYQTAGRGRLDRRWSSAPGSSLLVSILVPPVAPSDMVHLVGAAALALGDALEALCGLSTQIKWPNDIVVDDRKLAGILSETCVGGGDVQAVVVGIGCNLTPEAIPAELRDLAVDVATASGQRCDRDALLDALLRRLDVRLDALQIVAADVAARSATLGRRVLVEQTHGSLAGVATGLTANGGLLVTADDGSEAEVVVGDVVHLRHRDR